MNTIAISLFSLVKSNNGLFKSEKQGKFLLSKTNPMTNNQYAIGHGNNMLTVFTLDNEGVLLVEKVNTVKGVRVWTSVFNRLDESVAQAVADKKTAKKERANNRRIKEAKESLQYYLDNRESFANGSYADKVFFDKNVINHSQNACVELEEGVLFGVKLNLHNIYQNQLTRLDNIVTYYCQNKMFSELQNNGERLGLIRERIQLKQEQYGTLTK